MTVRPSFLENASVKLIKEDDDYLGRARDRVIKTTDGDLERANDDRLIHAGDDDSRPIEANDEDGGTSRRCLRTPTLVGGRTHLPSPREKAWAVAFKVNVVFTIISAVWGLATRPPEPEGWGVRGPAPERPWYSGAWAQRLLRISFLSFASVPLTYVVSRWMLRVMSTWPKKILQVAFVVFVLASVMLVNQVLESDAVPWATFAAVVCAGVGYVFVRRGRTAFATENLKMIRQMVFVVFVLASVILVNWTLESDAVPCAIFAAVVCAGVGHVFVRRGRIAFAAQNLKVAAIAVRAMPKVFLWSLSVAVVRLALLVAAGYALDGSRADIPNVRGDDGTVYSADDCELVFPFICQCNGKDVSGGSCKISYSFEKNVLRCFWVGTMGWGFAVCNNVMTATVARLVSVWWSSPEDVEPVWKTFHYVMNSSLGTLCKGSTVDGVIEWLSKGLQLLPSRFQGFPCLPFSLYEFRMVFWDLDGTWLPWGALEYLVQPLGVVFGLPTMLLKLASSYIMGYTAVFVGMEDISFSKGLGRTKELFRTVGMAVLINEIVVGVGLFVTGLASFALYQASIFGLSMSMGLGSLGSSVLWELNAVFVILLAMVEVVLCAYRAIFVCFVTDPEAFSTSHDRQLLVGLTRAWQTMKLPRAPDTNRVVQL